MKKYILEIIVFVSGFAVLLFEIVGARMLGPYFGTSSFVWTSIISIILASLSIGYYAGGKLSDKYTKPIILSHILLLASAVLFVTILGKDTVLALISGITKDIRIGAILASIILFAPTSILLGMVSPYSVRLALDSLKQSGAQIGKLSALSTVGSILGSVAGGFWLLPAFGVNQILIFLPIVVLLLSVLLVPVKKLIYYALVLLIYITGAWTVFLASAQENVVSYDTMYSHVKVRDYTDASGERFRMLQINIENHSAKSLDSDRLVNDYTRYYHIIRHFVPNFSHVLMLGGAGYSYPQDYLKQYPDKKIDVVEIDPGITEIAKKHFGLTEHPNLQIFHEDARVFLNSNTYKYDAILGDAFSSWYSLPYQLTTKEAVQKHYDSLSDSGVVVLNIISALEGELSQFLRAEYRTYKEIFPDVKIFPVTNASNPDIIQNIILVAIKNPRAFSIDATDSEVQSFLANEYTKPIPLDMPILTDNYAPVDSYITPFLSVIGKY